MKRFRTKNRLYLVLAACAILLAGGFYAGAGWYARWSAVHLPALAGQLGEVWMVRAGKCEAAGAMEEALTHYQNALAGGFHGPQNRNHCEKRCGMVLAGLGRYEEALPHLQRAQAEHYRTLNGYQPLVNTLMALERWEEAREMLKVWLEAAKGDMAGLADARQAEGRVAIHDGDLVAAEACFEEALERVPDHPCRADLAKVHAMRGDLVKARAAMGAYLETARPNGATAGYWDLLEQWERP